LSVEERNDSQNQNPCVRTELADAEIYKNLFQNFKIRNNDRQNQNTCDRTKLAMQKFTKTCFRTLKSETTTVRIGKPVTERNLQMQKFTKVFFSNFKIRNNDRQNQNTCYRTELADGEIYKKFVSEL